MQKIADFVYSHSRLVIIFVVLVNITALASFIRFSFDTDILNSFNQGNPKAEEYNRLNAKYGSAEPVTVLVESESSLLSRENLLALFQLQQDIRAIQGVSSLQAPLPPEIVVGGHAVPVSADFIDSNYLQLADFINEKYFLTDQLYSADRLNCVIAVLVEPGAVQENVISSLEGLKQISAPLELSLAGNAVIQDTMLSYLLRIIFILPPAVVVLILLVFSLMLKNIKMAVLSMVPAGLAALWTFGTIFWSGQGVGLTTILSPIFVMVVGSAYGLHYVSHLMNNIPLYSRDKHKLTVETLRIVGVPVFLAAITTMAGFASLVWTDLVPMRQMGIYVTLGIGYAGFMAIFFLPAVLSRISLPRRVASSSENRLSKLVLAVSGKRVIIAAVFAVVVLVSILYIPRIEVVSNQLMFFKDDSGIRQTFDKIEQHFGGAVPLIGEIGAENPQASLLDPNEASRVLSMERELEQVGGISSVFSIFDLVKGVNQMLTGQDVYPDNPLQIKGIIAQLGEGQSEWVSADGFRMVLKTQGFTNDDIGGINAFVAENDSVRTITGLPVLFDEMNNLVVKSQVQSLGLAMVVIFLMLWITLRRFKAALVGLVPTVITIVAILGMLSIAGFNLNIMTATLSAIAIGIGIDYSIHLLSAIYHYRGKGSSANESIRLALSSVSRPILANALGLVAGYSAFFFSPLKVHMHAGAVMWVAMLVSSMAALLLVPVFFSKKE